MMQSSLDSSSFVRSKASCFSLRLYKIEYILRIILRGNKYLQFHLPDQFCIQMVLSDGTKSFHRLIHRIDNFDDI